jgi:hypothetical protein
MANIYTEQEIIDIIKNIDLAMAAALAGKSYELDTGQGRQKVTRQDLDQLQKQRRFWNIELQKLAGGGIIAVDYSRRC